MVTLILLSNASSLALEQPGSMVRGMSGRRLLIFFGKLDDLGDAAMRGPEHLRIISSVLADHPRSCGANVW